MVQVGIMAKRTIRIGNKEYEVIGSMQEVMALTELKKSDGGLTPEELLERAPFRNIDEVIAVLRFLEGKGKVKYDPTLQKWSLKEDE